jgi:predicted ATP-binding protein involved in virulence
MPISNLRFNDVGPFDEIEFEFDEHVNVFTGPNNSGKSAALMVLAEVVVNPFRFPKKLLRSDKPVWRLLWTNRHANTAVSGTLRIRLRTADRLRFLTQVGYTTFVPALRRSTDYRSKGPTAGGEPARSLVSTSSSLISDRAIVQKIIGLDYKAYRHHAPGIRGLVDAVAVITSEITEGFSIQFIGVDEDYRGFFLKFRTPDGDIPLNLLSQGTQSLIQWLFRLLIGYTEYYDDAPNAHDEPGILIIDEIDAHLHPSWQRRIIPALTRHFPNLQIFCSTHSPLMLAGLKEGQVQLLRRDADGKVTVSRNETDIVGWSADEILRSFLDVRSPTDVETTSHIERLQELRRIEEPSAEEAAELEHLRHAVNQDLIGGPMASQLEEFKAIIDEAKADLVPKNKAKPPARSGPRRAAAD